MKRRLSFEELMGIGQDIENPVLENLYEGNRSAYNAIKELTEKNSILPFIGAGFSAEIYPVWSKFLSDISKPYPNCRKDIVNYINDGEYEKAADLLCDEMTSFSFQNKISNTFGKNTLMDKFDNVSADRKNLPDIFRGNILTTNYDRVLETIYHNHIERVCPHTEYQKSYLESVLHCNGQALIKLHGDVEDINNIVITTKDYEKIYGRLSDRENPTIFVQALREILQNRVILFLGCSLCTDRTMQVLYDSVGQTRQFYALAELPKDTENKENPFSPFLFDESGHENPEYRKRRQFMGTHHINCIWYPYGEHATLDIFLKKLWEDVCSAKIVAVSNNDSFIPTREIVGRDNEIKELSNILFTQNKIVFVTGAGGIGKTELCSNVIKQRLVKFPEFRMPYIELFGVSNLESFYMKVAASVGYKDIPEINNISNKLNLLTDEILCLNQSDNSFGLYFDNWEDLWIGLVDNEDKRILLLSWMESLAAQGVKILISSREQPREYDFSLHIHEVPPLDDKNGYDHQLFSNVYYAKGGKLKTQGEEYNKILQSLGGHPLSIVLVATYASAKVNWQAVLGAWTRAEIKGKNKRHNNLRTAIGVSWESISQNSVCIYIWGLLSLCIDNPKPKFIISMSSYSEEECYDALTVLYNSSILNWSDAEKIVMLSPIKEVFFQLASKELIEQVFLSYCIFFEELISNTSLTLSDRYLRHSQLIDMLPQIYYVIIKLIKADLQNEMIRKLCYALQNYYQFNCMQSVAFLQECCLFAKKKEDSFLTALILFSMGELKSRLGEVEEAMELYGSSEELYRKERNNLGLANVLKSMGDVKSRLGEVEEAMELYGSSEELYRKERDNLGLANVLQSMGDVKRRLGDVEEAMELYGSSEELYRKERSNLGLANVLQSMGDVKSRLGEVEEAMELYGSSEELYRKERSNLGLANVLQSMGDVKRRLGEVEEAMELYGSSEELYRKERDNLGLANVFKSMGDVKSRLGEIEEAMELYRSSEELHRKERDNLGLANVLQSMGDVKSRLGEVEEAMELYRSSEELHRKERDNLGLANVLQSMGDVKSRLGEVEEAMELYGSSEELYRKERSNLGLANVLQSMGDVKRRLGEVEEAMELYGSSEELYRKERDNIGLANVLKSMGDVKRRLGEIEEAMELYGSSEELHRKERSNLGLANVLKSMGDVKSRLGEVEEAMELYGSSEELYRKGRSNLGLANVLQSMGDVFLKQKNFSEAITRYEQALNLYDKEQDILGSAYTMSELCLTHSLFGEKEKAIKFIFALNKVLSKIPYKQVRDYIEKRINESKSILELI